MSASNGQFLGYLRQTGPYGKDGPPPSRFMSPIPAAHQPLPAPGTNLQLNPRTNIAGSERALPPVQRFQPKNPNQLSLSSQAPLHHLKLPTYSSKLSPPKPAFIEPQSPRSVKSFDSVSSVGMTHGQAHGSSTDWDRQSEEKAYLISSTIRTEEEKDRQIWEDLERAQRIDSSSNWLHKQSRAGNKFKTVVAVLGGVLVLIIIISVVKVVTKPSSHASPAALKWANGVEQVPNFAKPNSSTTTTTSTNSNKQT